jgi:hypothetical protein
MATYVEEEDKYDNPIVFKLPTWGWEQLERTWLLLFRFTQLQVVCDLLNICVARKYSRDKTLA